MIILVEKILRHKIVLEDQAFYLACILQSVIRVIFRWFQAVRTVHFSLLFDKLCLFKVQVHPMKLNE